MSKVLSKVFISLSHNQVANRMAKKYGLKFGAARFVAGNSIENAVKCVRELNQNGMVAMLNYLGEFVSSEVEAAKAADNCIKTLDAIYESGIDSNLSVKISSLGLDISKEVCLKNLRRVLDKAKEYGNFVRIEMEDYSHCQLTLDIYKELRKEYDNIGTVLQAYLYRTEKDLEDLNAYNANLRLVKGAYNEPADVAFPKKSDVDKNYENMIKTHLLNGNYAGIATHDGEMVDKILKFIEENKIPKSQFEFQMLYGIRNDLQSQLSKKGYKVRVYIPYGVDWFGYFMRRLAERPENVAFVLKNAFK
ncbi:proline dehydrogenase family protein [Schinkia azotoformans]|uniref:proline dehydrogenase family protein n=1 Tax=Schinkia azotoformans TaxID=1454 RepID=UPI002DBA4D69|nr:proline dehydrogenase family protein [Schinkia azotoformans]MEC1715136.1 proline dehydrogenase family protein [Schinkia azotoformans]MEC1739814.1 proline dehydrogenase family protein [Schinkia azotoformans]MEC1745561.1 proline dehydrogenase family protein [Schinkia azotoformans]MEC1760056.1 proline dehydrogenase family protein [Schinkia azotoformans]MEC1765061.1 proline dehydrogenase family protein [Schinkia azotoformans]